MPIATSLGIHQTIAHANQDFMSAFNNGDAAGLADLYTMDGQVLPPNNDIVRGKEEIQTFWQTLMDMGIQKAKLDIVEVEEQDELVVELSKYTLQGTGGASNRPRKVHRHLETRGWPMEIASRHLQQQSARPSLTVRSLINIPRMLFGPFIKPHVSRTM